MENRAATEARSIATASSFMSMTRASSTSHSITRIDTMAPTDCDHPVYMRRSDILIFARLDADYVVAFLHRHSRLRRCPLGRWITSLRCVGLDGPETGGQTE